MDIQTALPFPSSDGYLFIEIDNAPSAEPSEGFCISFDLGKLSDRAGFDLADTASKASSDFSTQRVQRMLAIRGYFLPLLALLGLPRIHPDFRIGPPIPSGNAKASIFHLTIHAPSDRCAASALSERAAMAMRHLDGCIPFMIPLAAHPTIDSIRAARAAFQFSLSELSDLQTAAAPGRPAQPAPRI